MLRIQQPHRAVQQVPRPPSPSALAARGLPGDFHVTPGGWSFERDRRHYAFTGSPWVLDVEAWIAGHPHWRTLDVRIAIAREDFAAEAAPGDEALQAEVRRDLNIARMRFQLMLAQLDFDEELDRLEEQMEEFLADGAEEKPCVDLMVLALPESAARRLVTLAKQLGAKAVNRRAREHATP